jgi:prolyl-tRNA editing enzyme YbaK/EbsC (Cys-tRNA(Pro) deacylase)
VASLTDHPAVERVRSALVAANHPAEIVELSETARTAADAASALGIEVGQVASSIVFGLPGDPEPKPLLVITSGRHRVDTQLVAELLNVEKLLRVDADLVRERSGFAIGGVPNVVSATSIAA